MHLFRDTTRLSSTNYRQGRPPRNTEKGLPGPRAAMSPLVCVNATNNRGGTPLHYQNLTELTHRFR
jgi:hypothetical protein